MRLMTLRAAILPALILVMGFAGPQAGQAGSELRRYAAPGPFPVGVANVQWDDSARGVTVKARVYYPLDTLRHPLLIFSHGLGNSRRGYRYLGEQWASWGFISVHIEHRGAGEDLHRRGPVALYLAGFDRHLWISAPDDVHVVLDHLLSKDAPPFLRDRIDRAAIGVAGHSLGAYVALATAGAIARLPVRGAPALADRRISAAVALSMSENLPPESYGRTAVPILHMTGTRDSSLLYGTTRRMRRIPFDSIDSPHAMLVTINGADHSTFSDDRPVRRAGRRDIIKAMTVLWWRAFLDHDATAEQLLFDPRTAEAIAPAARIETTGR